MLRLASSRLLACLLPLLVSAAADAGAPPASFQLQGKLTAASGAPIEAPAVALTLQLRSPDGACLLYEELHTLDLRGSGGLFSVAVGTGTRKVSGAPAAFTLAQAFSNSATLADPALGCPGNAYTPADGDARAVRIRFDTGGGPVTLTPDRLVRSVPYALVADTLRGKSDAEFVQLQPGGGARLAGGVQLGDDAAACDASTAGTIRFAHGFFYFCDGGGWKVVQLATPSSDLVLAPTVQAGMDVTNGAGPGAFATFTVTNRGSGTSAQLTTSLSDATHFQLGADTCNGVALGPGSSCTVGVRPIASANGSYAASLRVTAGGVPSAALSGTASGFNAAPTYSGGAPSVPSPDVGFALTPLSVGGFGDADGDPLTFSAAGPWPAGLSVTRVSNSTARIEGAPLSAGSFAGLTIVANDGHATVATPPFSIVVRVGALASGSATVNQNGSPGACVAVSISNGGDGRATGFGAPSAGGTYELTGCPATDCTGVLLPGASCTVSVRGNATVAGPLSGSVAIVASVGGAALVTLTGSATLSPLLTADGATHTELDCLQAGGAIVSGAGVTMCRFNAGSAQLDPPPFSDCRNGWVDNQGWTATTAGSAQRNRPSFTCSWTLPACKGLTPQGFTVLAASYTMVTGSHGWANAGVESQLCFNLNGCTQTRDAACDQPYSSASVQQIFGANSLEGVNPVDAHCTTEVFSRVNLDTKGNAALLDTKWDNPFYDQVFANATQRGCK